MNTVHGNSNQPQPSARDADIARMAAALERLERRLDEFFGTFLNAKFPHGRAVDRWGRRGV